MMQKITYKSAECKPQISGSSQGGEPQLVLTQLPRWEEEPNSPAARLSQRANDLAGGIKLRETTAELFQTALVCADNLGSTLRG